MPNELISLVLETPNPEDLMKVISCALEGQAVKNAMGRKRKEPCNKYHEEAEKPELKKTKKRTNRGWGWGRDRDRADQIRSGQEKSLLIKCFDKKSSGFISILYKKLELWIIVYHNKFVIGNNLFTKRNK